MIGFDDKCLNVMFAAFQKLDVSGDNEIEYAELCAVLRLESNEFTKEIFSECDWQKNGNINFCEFTMSMWAFLARDQAGLAEFAFEVFDADDTGILGGEEIETMVAMVYGLKTKEGWTNMGAHDGGNKTDRHIKTVMSKLDKNHDGKVSKKEFVERSRLLPMLLQPAFDVQESLIELCGGKRFWEKFRPKRAMLMKEPKIAKLFKKHYRKNKKGDLDIEADGKVKRGHNRMRT